ncbi:MAG: AAA family ATPase [Actinomycetia bacterium]|nr:AAA family ATPase [Actinomycetes bacterium]
MSLVVIVDSDAGFCRRLRVLLENDTGARCDEVRSLAEAREALGLRHPDTIVLGPTIAPAAALEFAESYGTQDGAASIVYVTNETSTDLLRRAMRAGLRDVVPADQEYGEVVRAVQAALDSVRPRSAEGVAVQAPVSRGRVVTVFSTKGGVGKTVISCNVAVALAELGLKTVLVDLDLQFGDVGIMLDLTPDRTIFDAVQSFDRLDAEMLSGFLTPHASGLQVLLAPVHPEDAEVVTVSRISAVLGLLREVADFVVIDTAAALDDAVLAAIDSSDTVYAVATMDVASIKNVRVSLQKLAQMGYDHDLTKLVINRADSKVWLDPGEAERSIDAPVVAELPSDRLVPRSVNRGVPVVLDAPKSGVARALAALAKTVAAGREEAKSSVA